MKTEFDPTLARLTQIAHRYPILSFEREQAIAIAWRDHRDRAALDELVCSHLRLVVKIARGLAGYGLPIVDLVSEGNIGLMQAAERFDPTRGFRFTTYAIWWVRASMQEYILHSWSVVKIGTTVGQKKLFFNLRRIKARLSAFEQGDMAPEIVATIATELAVSEDEVIEMNRRLSGIDYSLHSAGAEDSEDRWIDTIADESPTQEAIVIDLEQERRQRSLLSAALSKLSPREREILIERHLKDDPATLIELSQRFSVSRERVRQIEMRAVEKVRQAIRAKAVVPLARSA